MVGEEGTCALCGLELFGAPVRRVVAGEERLFCCRGCASVYDVAVRSGFLEQVLAEPQARRSGLRSLIPAGEMAYFRLDGLWCGGCAVAAERLLKHQPGVLAAEVSLAAERGYLRYDPAKTDPETALEALAALGYRGSLITEAGEERAQRRETLLVVQFLVALAFGMRVMMAYLNQLYHFYAAGLFAHPVARSLQYLCWLLATPTLLAGMTLYRGAWRALRAGTATMDTLVTVSVLSAYGYSAYMAATGRGETYFDSATMIVTFVLLGRLLEAAGSRQARKDIRHLLRLQPNLARRRDGATWTEVPARQVAEGDTILVRPGERVPADAEIVDGQAALDEALLTGEALPVSKGPGQTVYAGTLVAGAALTCRVTRPPRQTRLAQITALVERTLAAKPPVGRLADQASAYLAVAVLAVAAATACAWWGSGHPPARALLAAVAVLVVACPCALGLATPMALTVVLGRAAREGILVRNPAVLEVAPAIGRAVFDKTGTLTRGRLTVVEVAVAPHAGLAPEEMLRLAAAVEGYSEHPIARAIVAAGAGGPPAAGEFRAVRGAGASALVSVGSGPQRVRVGSRRFVGGEPPAGLAALAEGRAQQGQTVVWVGCEGAVVGLIALSDELNPTAAAALRRLEAAGVQTALLSGDHPRSAAAVARAVGLRAGEGDCSPEAKAACIAAWQRAGERVAMVGDGVNDAPALAQADLSVTVAGGTDVAGEASDVVLTHADLGLVPELVALARRTRRIVRLNLGWALAYNLVTVPLAALGLISPAIAAAAMAASSLLVVGNSLRLRG